MAMRHRGLAGSAIRAVRSALRCGLVGLLLGATLNVASDDDTAAVAAAPLSSAELLKPGLYRISGPGGGAVLRIGRNGLVVVDANRAGTHATLVADSQRLANRSDLPMGAVVLTGAGPD